MVKIIKPFQESAEYSNQFAQSYDRKKITITKAGQTYNIYDYIQAQREDTEIYPTLEKYGNLQVMTRPIEAYYGDFSNALELRDLYEQDIKLHNLFDELPIEDKRAFDNDFFKFKQNGLEYFGKKAEKEIEQAQKLRKEQAEKPINVNVINTADKGGN